MIGDRGVLLHTEVTEMKHDLQALEKMVQMILVYTYFNQEKHLRKFSILLFSCTICKVWIKIKSDEYEFSLVCLNYGWWL